MPLGTLARMPFPRPSPVLVALALVAPAAVLLTAASPGSGAPAGPAITLAKTASPQVLAGGQVTYTVAAANPSSNPDAAPEYNVSFRDVLPAGVTYDAGSTTPTGAGEPQQFVDAGTGQVTLVWVSVQDVQIGDTAVLSFIATPDPATLPVGSTFTNDASAYAQTNPRVEPRFDPGGNAIPGTYTETASAMSNPTVVSALDITKTEPSPEGELLRGVHDHPTVYTLQVSGTDVDATSGVVVTDYLPASLEFLGCGGVDNSSAPEYPGAPSLTGTPPVTPCVAPDSVSTVVDPPPNGTTVYPPGVYTRVEWDIGALAAGQVVTIRYAAGIPLRANTASWPGGEPSPASLAQAANLDNNSGPSTREGIPESGATNIAQATGTYAGPVTDGGSNDVSASTSHTVTIEDLRMRKSVTPAEFQQLGVAHYRLTIDASEYASSSDLSITDVLPNGVCPLGGPGTNYVSGAPPECAGSAAHAPSVPYQSVTQNPDGTFTVVFSPIASIPVNGTVTVTYDATMRAVYTGGPLAGKPTSSGDAFTNHAALTATSSPRPGTGETGPVAVGDTSSATLTTGGLVIGKTLRPRSAGGVCGTDGSGYGRPTDFPAAQTQFRKGDVVCFKLRVDFNSTTSTRNPVISDFLPVGLHYVAGSETVTIGNTVETTFDEANAAATDDLFWHAGTDIGGTRYAAPGSVFEVVFAATVTQAAPPGGPAVLVNAMKLRAENSAGQGRSFRDFIGVTVVPAPPIGLVKGIAAIDEPATGPFGVNSNIDGRPVHEGSTVTFRIDLTNNGTPGGADGYAAGAFDTWDVLPAGIRCADIGNVHGDPAFPLVTPAVTCTDPGDPGQPAFAQRDTLSLLRIAYAYDPAVAADAQTILPGQTLSLTYDMRVPTPTGAGETFTDTASLRSYQATTNLGAASGGGQATYFPQDNIDTSVPADQQDAPAATDPSNVFTPGAAAVKTGVTSITEQANSTPDQATIGELVTYTYAVTVPRQSAVFGALFTDDLPAGLVLQSAPAPTLEFCPDAPPPGGGAAVPACPSPAPVPAGVALDPATGAVSFPGTYDNTTATSQRFAVTVTALVTADALATGQNAVDQVNTARFASLDVAGGVPLPPATATYTVNIRQPLPAIVKTNNAGGPVAGGQTVTYTLTMTNQNTDGSSTDRPPLHDTFAVDCLPTGMTFAAYGPNPGLAPVAGNGANGCPSGTTRLVWAIGDIPGGAAVTRRYTATVDPTAVGGTSFTNTSTLTGSTLNDGKIAFDAPDNPNERTYSAIATSTVRVAGAVITKTVDRPRLTIGDTGTWTISVSVPANTNFFDSSILDTVPAGITGLATVSVTCVDTVTGVACPVPGTPLASAPGPGGSTIHGWYTGDVVSSPHIRVLTLIYTGVIADIPSNTAGTALVNTADPVWNITDGRTPTSAGDHWDRKGQSGTATVTVIEPSLTVAKSVSPAAPAPGQGFDYAITVTNGTGSNVSAAYNATVTDHVPKGVVVDPASISAGGELTGADPVRGGGIITWSAVDLPGPLAPGTSQRLTYSAVLAPSATLTAAGLTNTAAITHYASLPAGGRSYTGPSATATVSPAFPHLNVAKTAVDGSPAYIGTPYTWRVSTTNTGGAPAFAVTIDDTLPPNWTYVAGSAKVTVAGVNAGTIDPAIVTTAGVQHLTWPNLGTLATGQAASITYKATPQPDVVTNPGVGGSVAQVNSVTSTGLDATGAPGNASGPYGGRTATALTRINSADVRIVKSHAAAPVAGAPFGWTLAVSNAGPDTAAGPFTVTDKLLPPATYVSATGSGWSCSLAASTVTCTRTNAADTLASGAAFPAITVTVTTPAGLAAGTVLTNTATVAARTFDPLTANNTSTDTAAITTAADLQIAKAHTGTMVAGNDATYTLDVVNNGPSLSQPPITVTDALPTGTTFRSAAGTGWSCANTATTVTCTYAQQLAVGEAAPQITVVVGIPASQTAAVANSATVSGTTPDPVPANNTDTDTTTPATSADLSVQKLLLDPIVAGTSSAYRLTVDNAGPSDAASPVRLIDTLPAGLTFTGSTSIRGTWTCTAAGQIVTCTLAGPLAADPANAVAGDAIVEIAVAVSSSTTGTVINTVSVSSPTPDPDLTNNVDTDSSGSQAKADLGIVKSHTGPAVAGASLTWTLAVTNHGPSDSPGPIVVTDALPAGVTYTSATGSGWACGQVSGLVTCTRAATLGAGATAPDIALVVDIDPSAGPATITNTASVTGPLPDPDTGNNTDSDAVDVTDSTNLTLAKTTTGANPAEAGGTTAFTLTVTNHGPSTADTVVVRDTLPAGLRPVSATGTGWTCAPPVGQTVLCARPSLAPGDATVTITAQVESGVPDGTTLTNTAEVTTATTETDTTDNTGSSTVDVVAVADLSLDKSHAAVYDTVLAGTDAVFTVLVRNGGPSDAVAPITVVDQLPAGMTFVSSTGAWTCGAAGQTVTCTVDGAATLQAGGTAPLLSLRVHLAPDAPPGSYTNTATVSSPTTDDDPANDTDTDTIDVALLANLAITKTHAGAAHVGDPLEFTLGVSNAGPSTASDVTVTDTLPDGLTYVSATGTGWTCSAAGQVVSCSLAAPLAPLDAAPAITVTATVTPAAFPQVTNVATAATSTPEDALEDNTARDVVDVPPLVDLAVTKSHAGSFEVGQDAEWTVSVANNGPTADPGPQTVVDTLPEGTTYASAAGAGWSCSAVGQTVRCMHTGTLAVGDAVSLVLTVAVGPSAYPSVTNTAVVSTPSEETDGTNNSASDPADVIPEVILAIDKSVASFHDPTATYRIAVTNTGPNDTVSDVVVTDALPRGLAYVSASGRDWDCAHVTTTVTCSYAPVLTVGSAAPAITLVTRVTSSGGSRIDNVASARGGNGPNGRDNTVSDDAALVIPRTPGQPTGGGGGNGEGGGGGGSGGTTPYTGENLAGIVVVGLLAAGLGVLLRRRRRAG